MFIYKITNIKNNKVYIGQTVTKYPKGRWSSHKNKLNNKTHRNPHLQSSWNKYGSDNFTFDVIEEATSLEQLNDLEIKYIKQYNSINSEFGYNIASGGTKHFTLSDEAREKISNANKNRKTSNETREKRRLLMTGRKMPPRTNEYKLKQSISKKKWWSNYQNKNKMKKIRKKQMTQELRSKISVSRKQYMILHGHNQAKSWPSFQDLSGKIYSNIIDMSRFSREHNLNDKVMRQVANGIKKTHKGWKLANNNT